MWLPTGLSESCFAHCLVELEEGVAFPPPTLTLLKQVAYAQNIWATKSH